MIRMDAGVAKPQVGAAFMEQVLQPEEHALLQEEEVKGWPFPKILIISIRPERLKRCRERLGVLNDFVVDVVGIDGRSLTGQEDFVQPVNELNRPTRGQIGCFLSHREAWQRIVQEGWENALIIEDDADLRPTTQTVKAIQTALTELKEAQQEWDLFYVARNPMLCKHRRKISKHVVEVGKTWGLFAYVVTQAAANELIQVSQVMVHPVDILVSCTRRAAKRKFAISPIPFLVAPETSDTVEIQ